MSSIDHIFLYLLLYASLIFVDKLTRQRICPKYINFFYLLPIALYIIVEGGRYGRGVDYFGYGPTYKFGRETQQPVFDFLNEVIRTVDMSTSLPYGICFHVYAIIFIFALFKLYSEYKFDTKFFLLFGCLATLYMTEWTIRQGVSMAFFLPGLYYLEKKKYAISFVFALLSVFTHYGNAVSIFIIYSCYALLANKPLPIKLTIPLYLIFMLFFSRFLSFIGDKMALLDLSFLGGNFQGYVYNSEKNFGEDSVVEEWQRGAIQQILTTCFYCGIIVVGYYHHKILANKVYLYNAFVLGILVVEPFHQIGSITRVFLLASVLWFIPLSLSFYNWRQIKNIRMVRISAYAVWIYIILYWGRYVFLNPSATYVWNIEYMK